MLMHISATSRSSTAALSSVRPVIGKQFSENYHSRERNHGCDKRVAEQTTADIAAENKRASAAENERD